MQRDDIRKIMSRRAKDDEGFDNKMMGGTKLFVKAEAIAIVVKKE